VPVNAAAGSSKRKVRGDACGVEPETDSARQEPDNDKGRSCDVCVNAHVTCTWPPGERRACRECTRRHDKCRIDGESVTQRATRGSGPKKKKARVASQPTIEEASEEAVEELTGKEATPEEATVDAIAPVGSAAPEEVPVVNAPPCLEELVWATLQEVRKMRESAERREHFEFGIWEELRKLATLKGREVALAQANVAPAETVQERAAIGKIRVPGKGKRKAREPEEEETLF
jgi:hypothetical protein